MRGEVRAAGWFGVTCVCVWGGGVFGRPRLGEGRLGRAPGSWRARGLPRLGVAGEGPSTVLVSATRGVLAGRGLRLASLGEGGGVVAGEGLSPPGPPPPPPHVPGPVLHDPSPLTRPPPHAPDPPPPRYIHLNPKMRNFNRGLLLRGMRAGIDTITASRFQNRIRPLAQRLAAVLDEVNYADRLHPMNHHSRFPYLFTTIVDTVRNTDSVSRAPTRPGKARRGGRGGRRGEGGWAGGRGASCAPCVTHAHHHLTSFPSACANPSHRRRAVSFTSPSTRATW